MSLSSIYHFLLSHQLGIYSTIMGLSVIAEMLVLNGVFLGVCIASMVTLISAVTIYELGPFEALAIFLGSFFVFRVATIIARPFIFRPGALEVEYALGSLDGRRIEVSSSVIGGRGKAWIDGSLWDIEGEDMPAGSVITISGVENGVLKASLAEPENSRSSDAPSRRRSEPSQPSLHQSMPLDNLSVVGLSDSVTEPVRGTLCSTSSSSLSESSRTDLASSYSSSSSSSSGYSGSSDSSSSSSSDSSCD